MIDIIILLYILIACSVIALILVLRNLFRARVWIELRHHASQVLTTIGYVKEYAKGTSAEIYNLDNDADLIKQKIGVVFQNSILDQSLSVYDNSFTIRCLLFNRS